MGPQSRCGWTALLLALAMLAGCSEGSQDQPATSATTMPDDRHDRYSDATPAREKAEDGQVEDGHVEIDPLATRQVVDGFGVSSRVWSDPHLLGERARQVPPAAQREILKALFGDLGLTRLRPILDRGVEPTNDNAEPLSTDDRGFMFVGKRADAHVELVSQAIAAGVRTYFPSPVVLEQWMNESNPAEYVEWAMAMLRRWRALGFPPPWYSPVNEPGHERKNLPAGWLTEVVKQLGRQLREEGFATKLVIPDDLNATEAYERASAVLGDAEARQFVGAVAYHDYGGKEEDKVRLRELADNNGIPVWMTEYSSPAQKAWPAAVEAAAQVHSALTEGGASGVDSMWGFFSGDPSTLVHIDFEGDRYVGYTLTPTYHITGQFSRFVTPGSTRVESRTGSRKVLVTAFRRTDGRIVIVSVNRGKAEENVAVSLTSGNLSGPVVVTRTSSTENGAALAAITPQRNRFAASLPPASVTTFVAPFAT